METTSPPTPTPTPSPEPTLMLPDEVPHDPTTPPEPSLSRGPSSPRDPSSIKETTPAREISPMRESSFSRDETPIQQSRTSRDPSSMRESMPPHVDSIMPDPTPSSEFSPIRQLSPPRNPTPPCDLSLPRDPSPARDPSPMTEHSPSPAPPPPPAALPPPPPPLSPRQLMPPPREPAPAQRLSSLRDHTYARQSTFPRESNPGHRYTAPANRNLRSKSVISKPVLRPAPDHQNVPLTHQDPIPQDLSLTRPVPTPTYEDLSMPHRDSLNPTNYDPAPLGHVPRTIHQRPPSECEVPGRSHTVKDPSSVHQNSSQTFDDLWRAQQNELLTYQSLMEAQLHASPTYQSFVNYQAPLVTQGCDSHTHHAPLIVQQHVPQKDSTPVAIERNVSQRDAVPVATQEASPEEQVPANPSVTSQSASAEQNVSQTLQNALPTGRSRSPSNREQDYFATLPDFESDYDNDIIYHPVSTPLIRHDLQQYRQHQQRRQQQQEPQQRQQQYQAVIEQARDPQQQINETHSVSEGPLTASQHQQELRTHRQYQQLQQLRQQEQELMQQHLRHQQFARQIRQQQSYESEKRQIEKTAELIVAQQQIVNAYGRLTEGALTDRSMPTGRQTISTGSQPLLTGEQATTLGGRHILEISQQLEQQLRQQQIYRQQLEQQQQQLWEQEEKQLYYDEMQRQRKLQENRVAQKIIIETFTLSGQVPLAAQSMALGPQPRPIGPRSTPTVHQPSPSGLWSMPRAAQHMPTGSRSTPTGSWTVPRGLQPIPTGSRCMSGFQCTSSGSRTMMGGQQPMRTGQQAKHTGSLSMPRGPQPLRRGSQAIPLGWYPISKDSKHQTRSQSRVEQPISTSSQPIPLGWYPISTDSQPMSTESQPKPKDKQPTSKDSHATPKDPEHISKSIESASTASQSSTRSSQSIPPGGHIPEDSPQQQLRQLRKQLEQQQQQLRKQLQESRVANEEIAGTSSSREDTLPVQFMVKDTQAKPTGLQSTRTVHKSALTGYQSTPTRQPGRHYMPRDSQPKLSGPELKSRDAQIPSDSPITPQTIPSNLNSNQINANSTQNVQVTQQSISMYPQHRPIDLYPMPESLGRHETRIGPQPVSGQPIYRPRNPPPLSHPYQIPGHHQHRPEQVHYMPSELQFLNTQPPFSHSQNMPILTQLPNTISGPRQLAGNTQPPLNQRNLSQPQYSTQPTEHYEDERLRNSRDLFVSLCCLMRDHCRLFVDGGVPLSQYHMPVCSHFLPLATRLARLLRAHRRGGPAPAPVPGEFQCDPNTPTDYISFSDLHTVMVYNIGNFLDDIDSR